MLCYFAPSSLLLTCACTCACHVVHVTTQLAVLLLTPYSLHTRSDGSPDPSLRAHMSKRCSRRRALQPHHHTHHHVVTACAEQHTHAKRPIRSYVMQFTLSYLRRSAPLTRLHTTVVTACAEQHRARTQSDRSPNPSSVYVARVDVACRAMQPPTCAAATPSSTHHHVVTACANSTHAKRPPPQKIRASHAAAHHRGDRVRRTAPSTHAKRPLSQPLLRICRPCGCRL